MQSIDQQQTLLSAHTSILIYETMDSGQRLKVEQLAQMRFLTGKAVVLNVKQGGATTKWIGQIGGGTVGFVLGTLCIHPVKGARLGSRVGGFLTAIPGAILGLILAPPRIASMRSRSVKYTFLDVLTVCEILVGILPVLAQHDQGISSEASVKFKEKLRSLTDQYHKCQSNSSKNLWEGLRYSVNLEASCKLMINYLIEGESLNLKNQGKKMFNLIMETYISSFEISAESLARGDLIERIEKFSQAYPEAMPFFVGFFERYVLDSNRN